MKPVEYMPGAQARHIRFTLSPVVLQRASGLMYLPAMRDLRYGYTHKFAFEHAVFANLSAAMPDRLELLQ